MVNFGGVSTPPFYQRGFMKKLLIILLLLFSCVEERIVTVPRNPHIEVTMLRIPYIPLAYTAWETPVTIYGTLESEDVSVERIVVDWWSDMYWNENDSSGYYKLLCRKCREAVWHDMDGTRDTMLISIDSLRWITKTHSISDSNGNFYNTLTPVSTMRAHNLHGSWMWLWWSIQGTVIDSQEIFLMD